jgi:phospholipid/cholesterol/gamma-HCH transport system substrate-binding protein
MNSNGPDRRLHPAWGTLVLLISIAALVATTSALFTGLFKSYVSVSLMSDRAGLVMDPGAKVKLRGVPVGRVAAVIGDRDGARLQLDLFPDQVKYIPANVEAQIRATTAFGAKYVDLLYPSDPSSKRVAAGTVLHSRNVSTEVQTVFQNLVDVLRRIDPPKLNAILSAIAQGVRGRGPDIGAAMSGANTVLVALNSHTDNIRQDWVSLKGFGDTYGAAANDLLTVLDASAVTSATITRQAKDLDTLLLNALGFTSSGINLLGPNRDNFVNGINTFEPTTALLDKYSPEYTCLLTGAKTLLDDRGSLPGVDGRSAMLDASLGWAADPYRYPDNLPITAAKGGPGGKPGCGSLPDVTKNWPNRYLVTNTGFGTGLDKRPNPGIAHPWWVNFLPVTRAVPEPPSIRGAGPPAIGPVPYPGAPPYGAPLYGPDGTPLYPGVPPAPSPPADAAPPTP